MHSTLENHGLNSKDQTAQQRTKKFELLRSKIELGFKPTAPVIERSSPYIRGPYSFNKVCQHYRVKTQHIDIFKVLRDSLHNNSILPNNQNEEALNYYSSNEIIEPNPPYNDESSDDQTSDDDILDVSKYKASTFTKKTPPVPPVKPRDWGSHTPEKALSEPNLNQSEKPKIKNKVIRVFKIKCERDMVPIWSSG